MNDEYWSVKRSAYAVVCITVDYHGTVTVWNTMEEAKNDVEERIQDFFSSKIEKEKFYSKKVDDGYEIRDKITLEGGKAPSVLAVICGMSNAAYQRKDGVFVVPITALKN